MQEFDWEAAVKEIDIACEKTMPSSSNTSKPSTCRQATLDKFVQLGQPRPPPNFDSPNIGVQEPVKLDDTSCSVAIDPQAAKTWIYPGPKTKAGPKGILQKVTELDSNWDKTLAKPFSWKLMLLKDGDGVKDGVFSLLPPFPSSVNVPLRDYQLAITNMALFSNTLVALPTGLGKTLIAAVVMYNYFRWFPEGKIVFAAPSRPLVMQQIEACHNIVGIPQEWTIDMTGQTSPEKRGCLWKDKRVFFVTPQVLEKDIQSGTCLAKYLVCLVIDEAHRALGNYSYCVAVRELMAVPVQLRILALTATPGSKHQTIQKIIDNLCISRLEYRDESDPDVIPYVHNRKIELIQVPMGKDAVGINNLLLEVIRPIVGRLSSVGVLLNRDYQTLSPCDLLNSRDKFRQAPPFDLPQIRYGEVEGYFGVLITLYHIRKLLSSHGIRPAYEMLEEKLKHGSLARLMSRNEEIWKAKLLMQQSLSHGASNPKLSKMIEVLIDHFKNRDPKNSRVIIFSNFRGSVRDIMDALANIGQLVKATQFVGQSSGKMSKGQTQKVQQAVLEKFRAGGYNVIVATSIGEEGLDIMEVDLVICFDANVSPLRMIQRMGRTGRKHDGRVDILIQQKDFLRSYYAYSRNSLTTVLVLACEGPELKGYTRKQASSKTIRKHMRNGGTNSFIFHTSPRMVPHIFKPEAEFVELSIEQFVPRGKKKKVDPVQTPKFRDKLTSNETNLLKKYFEPLKENTWRPSLIAFPHFQAFPSRVHNVMHSFRTGMLIDMMQRLQRSPLSEDTELFYTKGELSSTRCMGVENIEQLDKCQKDLCNSDDPPRALAEGELSNSEILFSEIRRNESPSKAEIAENDSAKHMYLFGSDFVTVDLLGRVSVHSIPVLCSEKASKSNCTSINCSRFHFNQDSCHISISFKENDELIQNKVNDKQTTSQTKSHGIAVAPSLCCSVAHQGLKLISIENVHQTTIADQNVSHEDAADETLDLVEDKTSILFADNSPDHTRDADLSPRLTNLIKSGVVPESPIHEIGLCIGEVDKEVVDQALGTPEILHSKQLFSPSPLRNEKVPHDRIEILESNDKRQSSEINANILSPELRTKDCANLGRLPAFPVVEAVQTPFANVTNSSCSEDWLLSSIEKLKRVTPVHKFKRLRKIGDCGQRKISNSIKLNYTAPMANPGESFTRKNQALHKRRKGQKKSVGDVTAFIEVEAEVSSDADVSDDEEDNWDNDTYDDSFIDDRVKPTASSSQAVATSDMMAIYRRSLLSQSPAVMQFDRSNFSPDSVVSIPMITEGENSPGCTTYSHQAPQSVTGNQSCGMNSVPCETNQGSLAIPLTRSGGTKQESWERKSSYYHQVGALPAINLEKEFSLQSEAVEEEVDNIDTDKDLFYNDQFYEDLDLDELEAQATELLRNKSKQSAESHDKPSLQNPDAHSHPTFDLGI
ncbi:Helicase, C-terminal [Dillenia turbinata]|uniref:Helicase, C-terminal n=1 Tax=Dillenia turbinata TaxID=194707 RepID=A0AAN8W2R8_9MAGN